MCPALAQSVTIIVTGTCDCPQHVLVPKALAEEALEAKSKLVVAQQELAKHSSGVEEMARKLQVCRNTVVVQWLPASTVVSVGGRAMCRAGV